MGMIETDVLTALQTAGIAAIASLATAPAKPLPIQAINRTFTPTTDAPDGKYFEFVQIVNNPIGQYWDDTQLYQGVFRIILHWPIDETGAYAPTLLRDQLANFFPKGKLFVSGQAGVRIYENPVASGSIVSGSELFFPLGLMYRCFKP